MFEWIIPCNPNKYNVVGAFGKFQEIEWSQSTNVQVGDIVYIYVGEPVQAIKYCCKAIMVDMSPDECTIDDSEFNLDTSEDKKATRYMRLCLI